MLFNFYGLYVPIECSSNNIEMAEDDHVHNNTKYMDLEEDNFEAAQLSAWSWQIVISSEADRNCSRSSSIKIAIHHIARTVNIRI